MLSWPTFSIITSAWTETNQVGDVMMAKLASFLLALSISTRRIIRLSETSSSLCLVQRRKKGAVRICRYVSFSHLWMGITWFSKICIVCYAQSNLGEHNAIYLDPVKEGLCLRSCSKTIMSVRTYIYSPRHQQNTSHLLPNPHTNRTKLSSVDKVSKKKSPSTQIATSTTQNNAPTRPRHQTRAKSPEARIPRNRRPARAGGAGV